MANKVDKTNFKFNSDKLDEFRSIIGDLSKISPIVKFKLTNEDLLLYSIDTAGDSSSVGNGTALAVKSFVFPKNHFMEIKQFDESDDSSNNIDWIIKNGKTLVKKLNFFNGGKESNIKGVFNLRQLPGNTETKYTRLLVLTDSKFKFSLTGDEPHVIRDLTVDQLNGLLDPNKSDINFNVPTKEFLSARSACDIESEEMVSVHLSNGKIFFKQSSWELLVGNTEFEGNRKVTFNKKYLKSINPKVDDIHLSVFENFILWSEGNQKMMVSFEQTF